MLTRDKNQKRGHCAFRFAPIGTCRCTSSGVGVLYDPGPVISGAKTVFPCIQWIFNHCAGTSHVWLVQGGTDIWLYAFYRIYVTLTQTKHVIAIHGKYRQMTTSLPNKHYSQHRKDMQVDGDRRTPRKMWTGSFRYSWRKMEWSMTHATHWPRVSSFAASDGVKASEIRKSANRCQKFKPGGRPPLLTTMPMVTFPSTHYRPLASTKLYCLLTEAHVCEQLSTSASAIAIIFKKNNAAKQVALLSNKKMYTPAGDFRFVSRHITNRPQ